MMPVCVLRVQGCFCAEHLMYGRGKRDCFATHEADAVILHYQPLLSPPTDCAWL